MKLQPFVGHWPLFQFGYLFLHRWQNSLDGRSARRKAATYTGQHKDRINAHTDIHVLSGIRTHDPSVRASEDSSCLRSRGHCARLVGILAFKISLETGLQFGFDKMRISFSNVI
jgi:hypothetical protein